MVKLPAREMRTADLPFVALAVRRQDERSFACTYQHSYFAHSFLLMNFTGDLLRIVASSLH